MWGATEMSVRAASVVIRGDARAIPLPDNSVDLIVTSPPYFALRSYTDNGEHYAGQIGSEATPAEYIDALIECTREMVRVLKPTGSIWIDLGDKYSGAGPQNAPGRLSSVGNSHHWQQVGKSGIPSKSLMLLPERYRIAAVDQLGLICRAVVVWSKPNGLPESVTDRVRRSHEDWVHLTKLPRYFAAVDEIREAYLQLDRRRADVFGGITAVNGVRHSGASTYTGPTNVLGKLPGSVWTIPTEPLSVPAHLGVDHFAAFPTEWPRRIILGWSPSGICTVCGEGRRPVAERASWAAHPVANPRADAVKVHGMPRDLRKGGTFYSSNTITGYTCACPEPTAPTRPAVILDPFGGTGTTALVASVLGRIGISVDRSADYSRLARWRTTNRGEIAKAMRVERPEPVPDAQLSLEWEMV